MTIVDYTTTKYLFTITPTGNVGIGTTSPNTKLQVTGVASTNSDAVYTVILNDSTGYATRIGSGISFGGYYDGTNVSDTFSNIKGFKENLTSGDYAGAMSFQTRSNGGNPTERMRITSGGNVLIGTTTTYDKLTINGGIRSIGSSAGFFFDDRSNSSYFYGWYSTGNTNVYFFNGNSGSNIASISPSTGVYTPLSDINKKKDFEQSDLGLNAILGLKPTLYRMKDEDNTDKHLGFIAQEVKEFIPQAFVDNDGFIGLDYQAITATLVKAIQEQQAQIEELRKIVATINK
jgi:hypothetical protein